MVSDYDEADIRSSVLAYWDGDDFCVLPYHSKKSGRMTPVTEFILSFKSGQHWAVTLATKLIVEVVAPFAESRLRTLKCQYVLAAPPHNVGKAKHSSESVCKALAERFGLEHLIGAL